MSVKLSAKTKNMLNDVPSGKLSGAFLVLEEAKRDLEQKWESGDILLTEGQVNSYKEAKKEVDSRVKDIMQLVSKFEKLNEVRKTL